MYVTQYSVPLDIASTSTIDRTLCTISEPWPVQVDQRCAQTDLISPLKQTRSYEARNRHTGCLREDRLPGNPATAQLISGRRTFFAAAPLCTLDVVWRFQITGHGSVRKMAGDLQHPRPCVVWIAP